MVIVKEIKRFFDNGEYIIEYNLHEHGEIVLQRSNISSCYNKKNENERIKEFLKKELHLTYSRIILKEV